MLGINPYNPYGYPAPFNATPNSTSANFQLPATQNINSQNGPDWIQVPTVKQVEQVSVQPGTKAWIMIQNEPIFALRVADNMGLVTTDYYRFEKIDNIDMSPSQINPEYITREEFERVISSLTSSKSKSKKEDIE